MTIDIVWLALFAALFAAVGVALGEAHAAHREGRLVNLDAPPDMTVRAVLRLAFMGYLENLIKTIEKEKTLEDAERERELSAYWVESVEECLRRDTEAASNVLLALRREGKPPYGPVRPLA